MDILNENITLDLTQEDDLLPFVGNIKDSFRIIERVLDENKLSSQKLDILKNITYVIDYLAEHGNVQEQLVFDTAQLYVFNKHTQADLNLTKDLFGKYAVEGAFVLSYQNENRTEYLKRIFENNDFLYLGKIKLADYIFELNLANSLNKKNNDLINEIKYVIEKYEDRMQKGLLNELKSLIN